MYMTKLHIRPVKKEKSGKWKRIFKARSRATVKVAAHTFYLVSKTFKTEMSRALECLKHIFGFCGFKMYFT